MMILVLVAAFGWTAAAQQAAGPQAVVTTFGRRTSCEVEAASRKRAVRVQLPSDRWALAFPAL